MVHHDETAVAPAADRRASSADRTPWRPPDWRRNLQLALATVWLLDGVLQLQPLMFTAGSKGLSGMIGASAQGNPRTVASSITWNAGLVDHHAVVANSGFALIQLVLGLGIAWRPAVKPALATSVVWSLGVWWFGEGLGGVLHGAGTPVAGGPGAVLFYALLAVVLWPAGSAAGPYPFAAAGAVGAEAAKAVWAVVWGVLAVLCLLGSGRAATGIHDVITSVNAGQPGWLSTLDDRAASAIGHDGLAVALVLVAVCLLVGAGVYLPAGLTRITLVLGMVVAVAIWVGTENFGMILAGGATDPNSGPLIVLLALAYWPVGEAVASQPATARTTGAELALEVR